MSNIDPAYDNLDDADEDLELPGEGDDEHDDRQDDEDDEVSGEARARAMGWKPLAEYRGDPRAWTDWQEFLRKGEEVLPVMRDQNRRMSERIVRNENEIARLNASLEDQKKAVRDAITLARSANDAGYKRAIAELKAERRAAAEAGEADVVDAVQEQIDAMEEERRKVAEPAAEEPEPPAETAAPAQPREIVAFIAANPWFNDTTRQYLREAMVTQHRAVMIKHPTMALVDQLEEARARLAADYPEIDGDDDVAEPTPRAPRAPAPPRARQQLTPTNRPIPRQPSGGDRTSPFDRIEDPAERAVAKSAYERIKRADPGMTAGEYMKLYDNPHLDALQLRRERKKA